MAETQPIWMQALCYNYNELRNQFDVCGEGVIDKFGGSLLVASSGAADHSVTVAAGSAWVEADGANVDGMYRITNDAPVTIQLAAGGGGNGRVDTIVATVHDSQSSGVDDEWVLTVVTGTPNAAAVSPLTDAGIAASAGAVPDMSLVLGYVLVPVADTLTTTISAVNIVDGRNNYDTCGTEPWIELVATAATSIGATTKVNLATTVHIDRDTYSVSASVVTVKKTGLYDIGGALGISAGAGRVGAAFTKNGTTTFVTQPNLTTGAAGTTSSWTPVAQQVTLAVNDTIQLVGLSSGGSLNSVHDAATGQVSRLMIRKVG